LTVEIADSDDSFAASDSVNSSNPVELQAQAWQHIGYSAELNANGVDTSIRFWMGDGTTKETTITLSNKFFLDDDTPHRTTVGLRYSD
jgi:hypothetical protein